MPRKSTSPTSHKVTLYAQTTAYGADIYQREKEESVTITKTNAAGEVIEESKEQLDRGYLTELCSTAKKTLGLRKGHYRLDITVTPVRAKKKAKKLGSHDPHQVYRADLPVDLTVEEKHRA